MIIRESETQKEVISFKEFEQGVRSTLSKNKNFSINYRSRALVFNSDATPKKMSFSSIIFFEYPGFTLSFSEGDIKEFSYSKTQASITMHQYSGVFKTGEFFSIMVTGD